MMHFHLRAGHRSAALPASRLWRRASHIVVGLLGFHRVVVTNLYADPLRFNPNPNGLPLIMIVFIFARPKHYREEF